MDDLEDAFGYAFLDCYNNAGFYFVIERDDGYVDVNDSRQYFAEYRELHDIERGAIHYAGKRVRRWPTRNSDSYM